MNINELYDAILDTYPQYTDYIDLGVGSGIEFFLSPINEYHYGAACFCKIEYYTDKSYTMQLCSLTENDFKKPNLVECKGNNKLTDGLSSEKILKIIPEFLPRYEAAIEWFKNIVPQIHELTDYARSLGFEGNGTNSDHSFYTLYTKPAEVMVCISIPDLDNLGYHIEAFDEDFNVLFSYSSRDFNECLQKVIE